MRLRLLLRRLTISAPSMSVRSALAWPLRWLVMAVLLGFSAAIGLWAFELGKSIAGIDPTDKEELVALRAKVEKLTQERDRAQSIANTSGSLLTTERVAQERLGQQARQLEADNRALRDDLGFFEKLIPSTNTSGIAIRALHVEVVAATQLKWQVLVIQPEKNAAEFNGQLTLDLAGTLGGKPWLSAAAAGTQKIQLRQYRRMEGVIDLPPQAVVKSVTAKVVDGNSTRAVQTIKL